MSDPRGHARRQLRSELREIGFWPGKRAVEPFVEASAQEDIRQRVIAGLDRLGPEALVAIERIVSTLQPGD